MLPYWILFCLVTFGALTPRRLLPRDRAIVWMVSGAAITILVGFRHEVGGDWFNYARQFDLVAGMPLSTAVSTTKDLAYYPLGWLIAQMGGGIYWLNLVCASLLVIGAMSLAKRQSQPWLALLAAVPYLLIVVGMAYTRQAAAVGCVMLGLVALGDHKLRQFVIWVLIGAAFHKSAVLMIPIAALLSAKNRIWSAAWVSVAAALGYWLLVHDSSEALWSVYVESDYASASEGAAVRVFMTAIPALIMIVFGRDLTSDPQERKLWLTMSWLALACIPMLMLSATATDRMALFLIPLQLFVFGNIGRITRSVRVRTMLVMGTVIYYALVQFVWLNFASHASAWLPYRFWLTSL